MDLVAVVLSSALVSAVVGAGAGYLSQRSLAKRQALLDYEYNAKKRLYEVIGPLRFQLLMACRDVVRRVSGHTRCESWNMDPGGYYGSNPLSAASTAFDLHVDRTEDERSRLLGGPADDRAPEVRGRGVPDVDQPGSAAVLRQDRLGDPNPTRLPRQPPARVDGADKGGLGPRSCGDGLLGVSCRVPRPRQ
jgi:hypothetical protein